MSDGEPRTKLTRQPGSKQTLCLLELWSWWPEPTIQVDDDVLRYDARAEINAKVLNVWLCVEDERVRRTRGGSAVNETGLARNSA